MQEHRSYLTAEEHGTRSIMIMNQHLVLQKKSKPSFSDKAWKNMVKSEV